MKILIFLLIIIGLIACSITLKQEELFPKDYSYMTAFYATYPVTQMVNYVFIREFEHNAGFAGSFKVEGEMDITMYFKGEQFQTIVRFENDKGILDQDIDEDGNFIDFYSHLYATGDDRDKVNGAFDIWTPHPIYQTITMYDLGKDYILVAVDYLDPQDNLVKQAVGKVVRYTEN